MYFTFRDKTCHDIVLTLDVLLKNVLNILSSNCLLTREVVRVK